MDGSALSRHFAVLGNLVQSGAGVAPVLAEGCSVGKSEAPRIAVFNHVVQGAARALESHGFRLFFFLFQLLLFSPLPTAEPGGGGVTG